jgi:hypothetical protein
VKIQLSSANDSIQNFVWSCSPDRNTEQIGYPANINTSNPTFGKQRRTQHKITLIHAFGKLLM